MIDGLTGLLLFGGRNDPVAEVEHDRIGGIAVRIDEIVHMLTGNGPVQRDMQLA